MASLKILQLVPHYSNLLSKGTKANMNRHQYLDIANRLIGYVNSGDPASFHEIVAPDVVVPTPYPGTTPDAAGLMSVVKTLHKISPDYKCVLIEAAVDELESKVVVLLSSSGTHDGYYS
jgi:hypothetical protein